MESQPQNPEFRNNPENFHLCIWNNLVFSKCGTLWFITFVPAIYQVIYCKVPSYST